MIKPMLALVLGGALGAAVGYSKVLCGDGQ